MGDQTFRRDNHYVPRAYLSRWASTQGRLWAYRTLVSHPRVPVWQPVSPRGVAYHSHLYTHILGGRESDEMERWLDAEFEAPAEEALRKATSDMRLTPEDWRRIFRFAAAQFVRTPAHFVESLNRWDQTIPDTLRKTLEEVVRKLEGALLAGHPPAPTAEVGPAPFPMRVSTKKGADGEPGQLSASILLGRDLWQFEIKRVLTTTINRLPDLRWTIVPPPAGMSWLTSDDPVIALNYYGPGRYDFKGGWGNPGGEILLPLSPHHLLYAQVGNRPPQRGCPMPRDQAELIQRFIVEHAHRLVFADEPDAVVPRLRPRTVDEALFEEEARDWQRWHQERTKAEREHAGGR